MVVWFAMVTSLVGVTLFAGLGVTLAGSAVALAVALSAAGDDAQIARTGRGKYDERVSYSGSCHSWLCCSAQWSRGRRVA